MSIMIGAFAHAGLIAGKQTTPQQNIQETFDNKKRTCHLYMGNTCATQPAFR